MARWHRAVSLMGVYVLLCIDLKYVFTQHCFFPSNSSHVDYNDVRIVVFASFHPYGCVAV